MFSIVSTVQLEPEPIPLQVKVVLFGERWVCRLLQMADPELDELFRVVADLGGDMPRAAAIERDLTALLPASAPALARLIDHGVRLAGDSTRITAQLRRLLDVLLEAEHGARSRQRAEIGAEDVVAAIVARRERSARVHERLQDAVRRDVLMIDTTGERVGQVNGLSVYEAGNEAFGMVTRISATSRVGEGQVIDVQRETRLGGPLHAKGVLIPEANVGQLMLRDDVVEAVAAGRFAIHAVRHVDGALELMTGQPAGDPAQPQADTVNGRIARRLGEHARIRRGEPRVRPRRPSPQFGKTGEGKSQTWRPRRCPRCWPWWTPPHWPVVCWRCRRPSRAGGAPARTGRTHHAAPHHPLVDARHARGPA